jgi:hypothetical protein
MVTTFGILISIHADTVVGQEWKELLLLLLGAFIGSYGKIIDYWFSDTDKDKMLVQKMDEEDGVSLSNTADMKDSEPRQYSPIIPEVFTAAIQNAKSQSIEEFKNTEEVVVSLPKTEEKETKVGVEIDEDGDGIMDGIDWDGDGIIDEYFTHRQCEHVWGDADGDGVEECLLCGKIKDEDAEMDG